MSGMTDGMMTGMVMWAVLCLLALLAVLTATALGAVWLARRLRRGSDQPEPSGGDGARELLRHRYAAGELNDEEYERRLAALSRH